MAKSKKNLLQEALEQKGFSIESIEYLKEFGEWQIEIDIDKTPLRGADNPITAKSFDMAMDIIKGCSVGFDNCPACFHPVSRAEESIMFCNNCRTDFNEWLNDSTEI